MADLPAYSEYFPRLRRMLGPLDYLPFSGQYVWQDEHALAVPGLESVGYRGPDGALAAVARNVTGESVRSPVPDVAGRLREVRALAGVQGQDAVELATHESAVWVFDQ